MRDLSMAALMAAETTAARHIETERPAGRHVTAEGLSEELARKEADKGIIARYDEAESEADEDRILAELVEEGHADALIRARIIDEDEATNLRYANPARYEELSRTQKAVIRAWIEDTFAPSSEEYWRDSYALKHDFEHSRLGFYVTEGQFKGAMRDAGYEPSSVGDFPAFSWRFKLRRPAEDAKWLEIELREELGIEPATTAEELDWMCWYALAPLKAPSARDWLEAAAANGMDEADFVASVVRLAEAGSAERDGDVWKIRREPDCE